MYGSSRYPGAGARVGSGSSWERGPTQLQAFIERACDPMLPEPNMALNLEISDIVNAKKANTPREAAVEVLKNVNSRNTHQSMLALHLLDTLVKNCGYPMHLQIATKDFLNELVRRFPERPPAFPPPPMNKILELIHEWKNTICVTSKHKEDLTNIRDMHRLLGYKGYRFRDFDKRAAQVLNPSDSLKSPEELEEEDRAAQAAKLQELIRRGTPKDLAAAQELMKIMAGAEPGKKPDYASQTAKELAAIQHRILMLNEMLDNVKPNEKFAEGDAFDQISIRCRNAQPKIQKWISSAEENDDADNMDKLLLMNDLINNVLERYEKFKKGDRTAIAEINPAFQGKTSKSTGKSSRSTASAAPNLIDFDEPAPSTQNAGQSGSSSNDIMDSAFGLEGLNLGSSAPTATTTAANNQDLLSGLSFPTTSAAPSSSGQPFYQQYQSQPPPQLQQQAVSWDNLNSPHLSLNGNGASSGARTASPGGSLRASPALGNNGQSFSALRPSTPGSITLGSTTPASPSTPHSGYTPNKSQPASNDHYAFGNFQQPTTSQQTQGAKAKDPFEDLLM